MAFDTQTVLDQIDEVLQSTEGDNPGVAATRLAAAIERLAPPNSDYRYQADAVRDYRAGTRAGYLKQHLRALRADVELGYVQSLTELVREAVLDDFLAMAEHLIEIDDEHGPPPAAVLTGAVLEGHVRKLAVKHGIEVVNEKGKTRAFEQISEDLVRQDVIRQPERRIIAGWYGQRTEAAHGRFENIIPDELPRIITGVREFIVRYPA